MFYSNLLSCGIISQIGASIVCLFSTVLPKSSGNIPFSSSSLNIALSVVEHNFKVLRH